MNKKYLVIIVLILLIVGAIAFFVNKSTSSNSSSSSSSSSIDWRDFRDVAMRESSEETLASLLQEFGSSDVAPVVKIEGKSLIYTGDISYKGYASVVALQDEDITKIVINSLGGEVYWGMKLGEVVYENQWDVQVREDCYSSCANYIFPAGKNKIINENALVGWHGSAHQEDELAKNKDLSSKDLFLKILVTELERAIKQQGLAIPDVEIKAMIQETVSDELGRDKIRKDNETAFYTKIGVNGEVAIYGHKPENYPRTQNFSGWTFSIMDMEKFNIKNVSYEGDVYPNEEKLPKLGLIKLAY